MDRHNFWLLTSNGFLKLKDTKNVLFHTLNWAPVLVDYAKLSQHDTDTFIEWTIDGDYIHRNFKNAEKIDVISSSDKFVLISFTRETDLSYLPISLQRAQKIPIIGQYFKLLILRHKIDTGVFDPLKIELFKKTYLV